MMADTRTALVTGICGQDGPYLAGLLLEKGYEVHGLYYHRETEGLEEVAGILPDVHMVPGDLGDAASLEGVLSSTRPDEVYNLGGMSSVGACERDPIGAVRVNGLGVLRMLEAIRAITPETRFFQASTSEVFGEVDAAPQSEGTPFRPRNSYGISKLAGHLFVRHHRARHGVFASNGILYNHESPRRGPGFVVRKITQGVARIGLGLSSELVLGNLDSRRDWGYAPDYAEAMWRALQHDEPDDFVIASGTTHSVRDILDVAFERVGIGDWEGHVRISQEFWRPAEDIELRGDISKIRRVLGWAPRHGFEDMVREMVDHDVQLAREA